MTSPPRPPEQGALTTERLWYKIGEAAARIGATPKELRYWERVIPELRPRRSKGNLRYYHVDEFPRLLKIRHWLSEGLTVADCRELLTTGQLARPLLGLDPEEPAPRAASPPKTPRKSAAPAAAEITSGDARLKPVLKTLKALVKRLSEPPAGPAPPKP